MVIDEIRKYNSVSTFFNDCEQSCQIEISGIRRFLF